MNNIFIEGIQGCGKTTLTDRLAASLPELRPCREGDYSPVELAWCAWLTAVEYESILRRFEPLREQIISHTVQEREHFIVCYTKIKTEHPDFYSELESHEIYNGRIPFPDFRSLIFSRFRRFSGTGYLFECSFFQNIIENLMLYYMLSDDEIIAFYRKLYDCIDKDHFLLLYLQCSDLPEAIRVIRKERCDGEGNQIWFRLMMDYLTSSPYGKEHSFRSFDDLIAHFTRRQHLELRIATEVIGERAILLPSKAWNISPALLSAIRQNP